MCRAIWTAGRASSLAALAAAVFVAGCKGGDQAKASAAAEAARMKSVVANLEMPDPPSQLRAIRELSEFSDEDLRPLKPQIERIARKTPAPMVRAKLKELLDRLDGKAAQSHSG